MAAKQPSPRVLSPDIPVVSYPTPNPADLMVVQDVDTRLPGYQPQNYGDPHPDSTTYPNLKLVFQTPLDNENNFMWVRRVYANERFNQEAYNYAIKYSGEDPSKPIYVRTYTLPRDSYSPLAKGSQDPMGNGVLVEESTDRIKDDQTDGQLDSLFIKVTRVYETLPGPGLTTKKKGAAGSIPAKFQAARQVTVTKTTVDATTEPDDTTDTVVESSVEQASIAKAQKVDSVLDTNIVTLIGEKVTPQQQVALVSETMVPTGSGDDIVVADALTLEGTVDNLGNGQSVVTRIQAPSIFPETQLSKEKPLWGIPMKFKVAAPPLKQSHVVEGTASNSDVDLGVWDMDASVDQVTEFKKKVTKSSMPASPISLAGTQTGTWGVEQVIENLNADVTTVSGEHGTKEHSIEPLGDGRAVEKKILYGGGTLTEYRTDETTGIRIRMDKSLVDPASGLPATDAHSRVDRQPIDVWNSIQIVSSLDTSTLPTSESWESIGRFAFPDQLLEVGISWDHSESTQTGTSGVINSTTLPATASWRCEAVASADASINAAVYTKIKYGHNGPIRIRVMREYFLGPPSDQVTATLIQPVYGVVTLVGYNFHSKASSHLDGIGTKGTTTGSDYGYQNAAWNHSHPIGPFVHSGVSLTNPTPPASHALATASSGSTPSGNSYPTASADVTARATASLWVPQSSTPITSGGSLITEVHVEKWRFGVWIRETVTGYHP